MGSSEKNQENITRQEYNDRRGLFLKMIKKKYTFGWQEKSSLLIGLAHQFACQKGISRIFNVKVPGHLVFWRDGQSHVYFSEESIKNWKEKSKNFLKKGYLKQFLKETARLRREFYDVIALIERTNLQQASDKQLLNILKDYYDSLVGIVGIFLGSVPEGVFYVDLEMRRLLEEHFIKEDIDDIYNILSSSYEFDITQQEIIDWFNMVKNKLTDKKTLIKHAKKYPSFFFNTYSWKDAIAYLEKRIASEDVEKLKSNVNELYSQRENAKKKRDELLQRLPEEAGFLSKVLRELSIDRFRLKNCWSGAELLSLGLFQEIARRMNIAVKDLFETYSYVGIRNFLLNKTILPLSEMESRKDAVIYKVEDGNVLFKSGHDARQETKSIFGGWDFRSRKKVSGMVANSGKISGRAQVVLVEDIDSFMKALERFQDDDILITTMTSPNMIPLAKKAAGIITNEGGVCSHAAVIAREMHNPRKKPCLVGTGDATRVFKPGDYVLLDCDKGEAKKITKELHDKIISKLKTSLEKNSKKKNSKKRIQLNHLSDKNILFFEDITKHDILSVGGKGANLGELYSNFPIPKGFCVTTNAHSLFQKDIIKQIKSILNSIDYNDYSDIENKSLIIRNVIFNTEFPEIIKQEILAGYAKLIAGNKSKVSVRSSATSEDLPHASFAGQHDSFLDVEGPEQVLSHIKKCFSSLYTPRAILYRKQNKVEKDVSMSVVVQLMVDVYCAGVAFSANPVNKNQDEILIDTALGMGEKIVSGRVTPDNYIYYKKSEQIKKSIRGNRAVLSDKKLLELVNVIRKIETYYDHPQDIEWAVDKNGKIHVLQSRPITTI